MSDLNRRKSDWKSGAIDQTMRMWRNKFDRFKLSFTPYHEGILNILIKAFLFF